MLGIITWMFISLGSISSKAAIVPPDAAYPKSIKSLKSGQSNGDYINSYVFPKQKSDDFTQFIYHKKAMDEMGAKYENMARQRELRKNHHLNSFADEYNYDKENRDLVSSYFRSVLRRQVINTYRSARMEGRDEIAREKREERPKASKVQESSESNKANTKKKEKNQIAVKANPTSASEDTDVELVVDSALHRFWSFSENVVERHETIPLILKSEAQIHYDLPQNTMHMDLLSPIVDSGVRYRVRDEKLPLSGDGPKLGGDKTLVVVSKSIAPLSLSTGMSYGVESSTVGYSLSKKIHGPLSAQVSRVTPLRDNQPNSTTVQLNFGLGF